MVASDVAAWAAHDSFPGAAEGTAHAPSLTHNEDTRIVVPWRARTRSRWMTSGRGWGCRSIIDRKALANLPHGELVKVQHPGFDAELGALGEIGALDGGRPLTEALGPVVIEHDVL